MPFAPFTKLYAFFDETIAGVLVNGTANMIALISPLMAVCFSIYVMLILSSYWSGHNDEPVADVLYRMAGWGAILTFGMNIDMYKLYVAPLINGLGDDLAGTVGAHTGNAAALDTMASAFVDSFIQIFTDASGVEETLLAVVVIVGVAVLGGFFMVIAIGYILLAKAALGVLVAVGPLFIASALFPASRELFKNWTAQCLNYAFLVLLFSFVAQIEIAMVTTLIPKQGWQISAIAQLLLVCAGMILVSLNLPSLAAALAGGIGISTMIRKLPKLPKLPSFGGGTKGGGQINPGTPSGSTTAQQGGALQPEQK